MNRAGDTLEIERVFTQMDFDRFAELSGDDNPIHVDPSFAATTRFGGTLCHGMLLFATLSAAISRCWPGALLLDQALRFPGPTFAGDRCRVCLEVLRIEGTIAEVRTVIESEAGHVCCEGTAMVQRVVS